MRILVAKATPAGDSCTRECFSRSLHVCAGGGGGRCLPSSCMGRSQVEKMTVKLPMTHHTVVPARAGTVGGLRQPSLHQDLTDLTDHQRTLHPAEPPRDLPFRSRRIQCWKDATTTLCDVQAPGRLDSVCSHGSATEESETLGRLSFVPGGYNGDRSSR